MPGSMRFASAGAGVEESGGLSQPVEHPGARRGRTTPSGHELSLARPPADSPCTLGIRRAACRDHSRRHRRRSTPAIPATPATPAWRPTPPPPRSARGRTVGSTTPGRRAARGHDVPSPRRRVVTNRRSRGPQPTVPAPSAARTRHVVTTRAGTWRRSTPAWRPAPPPPRCPRGHTVGSTTPGCRSAHGHDVPPPRRRVVTNCRSRRPHPTVPAPSAASTRHVVTTRAGTTPARPRPETATTAPGNTKRGRPEGRPRGGVWRESC